MPRWADLPTAAEYLATSERHMRRLVHERQVPFTKLGGKLRFDLDAIDEFLTATRVGGESPVRSVVDRRGNLSRRSA